MQDEINSLAPLSFRFLKSFALITKTNAPCVLVFRSSKKEHRIPGRMRVLSSLSLVRVFDASRVLGDPDDLPLRKYCGILVLLSVSPFSPFSFRAYTAEIVVCVLQK